MLLFNYLEYYVAQRAKTCIMKGPSLGFRVLMHGDLRKVLFEATKSYFNSHQVEIPVLLL